MGREYIPLGFLLTITATAFLWFQFYALPRHRREWKEKDAKNTSTAEPESHSKSSE